MRVAFTFRHLETSDAVKTYASEKIGKIQKYLRSPLDAEVVLSKERHLHKVEIGLQADGNSYHGHESSEDMYASIDIAVDKLLRQVRDQKAEKTNGMRHPHEEINGKTKG